jgi:hypothetical protein
VRVLGLAFDPDFATNHYVYVFVTVSDHEQQIVRFTDQNSIGTQRTLILGGLPTAGINHDGGALAFGPMEDLLRYRRQRDQTRSRWRSHLARRESRTLQQGRQRPRG